jgi:hypothetical protein
MHCARPLFGFALMACFAVLTPAATLERLSTSDMVQQSTEIVRGRVLASSTSFRGTTGRSIIYTHYTVQVRERWKGNSASTIDVAIPGGTVGNLRQTFPGTPTLDANAEYVFFLWTGRSGLTQIIGLSQGLLNVQVDASGQTLLSRGATAEPMVDTTGNTVSDSGFTSSLNNFRATLRGYGLVDK